MRLPVTLSGPARVALGSRIVSLAAAFGLNVMISRSLSLAEAGTVVLVLTLITTFATIGRFGTDNLALRMTASDAHGMRTVVRPMVAVSAIASALAAAGFAATAMAVVEAPTPRVAVALLGAVCIVPAAMSVLAAAVLRGTGRIGTGTFVELGAVPAVASAGLLLATLAARQTVVTALAAACLAYWVTAAWGCVSAWRVLPRLVGSAQTLAAFVRHEGRSLSHFVVTAVATFFGLWIPVLSLGLFATSQEVALYNSAARLAAFVGLVSAIQVTYLATQFAHLGAARDFAEVGRVARRATRRAALVAGFLALALVAFPSSFLTLFGPSYVDATQALRVLSVGAFVQVTAGPSLAVMLTCRMESLASRLTLGSLVTALLVCPLLAPQGPGAVAWGAATLAALPAVVAAILVRGRGIRTSLTMGEG